MSPQTPRISVMMSTFNTGELIHETIDAILAQDFDDWEFVIIDDCSTDDTFERVNSYDDPRIHAYRNETNLGISRTRNRALELARGDYLAATDHDDISLSTRLSTQVRYLDEHPDVVMLASAAKELRNGKLRSLYKGEMRSHILAWRLHTRCSIVHSSVVFRRSTLQQHALQYRPEFHYAEDFVLFQELSRYGEIKILPDELVIYREQDSNASTQHGDEMGSHGQSFLHELYTQELSIDCSQEQVAQMWTLFNSGLPASSEQELLSAGRLYAQAFSAHLSKASLSKAQEDELRQFASGDWWRAVSAYASKNRLLYCTGLYDAVPELATIPPASLDRLRCRLKSALRMCLVRG